MRTRIAGSLGELGHDVRRGRQVGIAHAEIDHVLAAGAGARLHGVHLGKHIRRQAFQAMEFRVVHLFSFLRPVFLRPGIANASEERGHMPAGLAGWLGSRGVSVAGGGGTGVALTAARGGAAGWVGGSPDLSPPTVLSPIVLSPIVLGSTGGSLFCLLAATRSRCARSSASRAAASFSSFSSWAFWPPLAATIDPSAGVLASTGMIAAS